MNKIPIHQIEGVEKWIKETSRTYTAVQTHSVSPIVPTPTTATQAANKGYVDNLKEHQINGTRHTANITGTFNFDWNAYSQFVLTPTGATTLGNVNLPTGTNSKEIKGIIKAGAVVTLPANWNATADSDAFDNTLDNHFRAWVSAEGVVTFTNKNKAVTGGVNQAYVDQGDEDTLQAALDADAALSERVVHIEGDETIIGHKTFTGISRFDREFYIKKSENGLEPLLGYMQIGMFGDNIIQFVASSVGINSEIGFDIGQVTGYREFVLPDKDGTVALLSDIVETSRTIKLVSNTTQYTLLASDFTTNSLRFTANGGQTINVLLNAGVQPLNGSLHIVIEGDCKLNFTYGTGVTAILPPGAIGTTLGKGSWIGSEYVSANVISWNGDLDGEGGGTTAIEGQTLTGTAINLSNIAGNNYNYASPSSATTYTFNSPVINGFARCFINSATEPTVTGATKVGFTTFIANQPMEMVIESPDGSNVEYYLRER